MSKSRSLAAPICFIAVLLASKAAFCATSVAAKNLGPVPQLGVMNERLNQSLEQNAEILQTLAGQSANLSSMRLEQVRATKQFIAGQKRLQDVQHHLAVMTDEGRVAARQNYIATVLNILGLIFGVLGGVLLAGSLLSARQERITDIRVKRGFTDLGTLDTSKQKILNFFGLLGGISIAIGFVFQFIGALVTAPLSWFAVVALGLLAFALVVWLFSYFLAYTPDQTSSEKVEVVVYNLRRHIVQPMWKFVSRRRAVTCQECLQVLTIADAKVWWVHERNDPTHPYLHSPCEFHYGHEACLTKVRKFRLYLDDPGKQDQVHRAAVRDFLGHEVQKLRAWFVNFHQHWMLRGKSSSGEAPGEEQLTLVVKDVSPFAA
jgi:hypothetical protein